MTKKGLPCDGPISSLRASVRPISDSQRIIAVGSHPIIGFYISSGVIYF